MAFAFLSVTAGCKRKTTPGPRSIYNDAWAKLKRGDLNGARADVDAVGVNELSPATEWPSRFRVLEAEISWRQGMNSEALALLEAPIPSQFASCDISVWRKLTQGAADSYLERYSESAILLAEAELLAKTGCPELLGHVALRKGTLAFVSGDLAAAQSRYMESLRIARNLNDPFLEASALGNLGMTATKRERYDESIDWNRAALQLSQSAGAKGSTAVILGNTGWSYLEMGDFDGALALFRQADEASGRAGSMSAQVDWKINIGNVYLAEGSFDSAEQAYQQALELASKLRDDDAMSKCFDNLALVALERGQVESAQRYNEKVAPLARAHSDLVISNIVAGRIHAKQGRYRDAGEVFKSVIRDSDAPSSLRWEAQARLADVYASEGKNADADRQYRHAIDTIATARSAVRNEELRLPFLSNAISFYNDYIEFLIAQTKIETALQIAEVSRAQTLAEGLGLHAKISFPLPNFQPRLIAQRFGATLLFYWLGKKHSYLWAATRTEVSLFTLPPSAEIEPIVKAYQEALLGPRDVLETSNAAGARLYEILVAPARKLIPNGSRVIILPDGGLYGLNFETLLVPSPQPHYWIDDVVLANANSLVLLTAPSNVRPGKSKKLLLIGNPVSPSPDFPDLPQATAEISGVERYFGAPDRTVLSREQATAAAYLHSSPGQYSFVHFVSHGTASRTSPLDSAVILTKDGDSFKLYARDIVTQPLHADLVTISACYGAGARTYSGEGLVGLSWAFLRAGAHGVIAALWEVNDNSTPELMSDLYSEITKGSAPDAALRHAKLKLLHSGTVYQKPFYWAPFELYRGH